MSYTLTTEYVWNVVESKEGYKLLSNYKNAKTPVTIKCPKGHIYEAIWPSIRVECGCPYCKWGSRTKEETIEYIESYGYQVLDIKKENKVYNLLKLKCPEGHIYETKFSYFKRGHRCPYCFNIEFGNKKRLTYDFVKEIIESNEGYKLLSEEYKSINSKIEIQCPEGHIFWTTLASFHNGSRCPQCADKRKGATQRLSYDYIKEYIESFDGYKLLSEEYKNCHANLEIECPQGHKFNMSWSNFRKGHRCLQCADKRKGATRRFSHNQVKEYIESFDGHKLLSEEYKNAHNKLKIKCPEGHTFWIIYSDFQQGRRCPTCSRQQESSKAEKEITGFLKQYISDIVCNCWGIIVNPNTNHYMELDIWLPRINKAIEFNGVYWHSTENIKERDRIKKEQCNKLGIDLLIIEEEDWEKNKEKTLEEIVNFIDR